MVREIPREEGFRRGVEGGRKWMARGGGGEESGAWGSNKAVRE